MEFSNGTFSFSGREATVLGLNKNDKETNQAKIVAEDDLDIADIYAWYTQRENVIDAFEEACHLPAGSEFNAVRTQKEILEAHRNEAAVLIAEILSLKGEIVEVEDTYHGDPTVELHNYGRGVPVAPFAF